MEKQPDKLDVLMDWFLGDAKEITSKLESVSVSVTEAIERLDKASDAIAKSSETAKTEVIASQRELVNTLKKEQKVSEQFFERLAGAHTGFSKADTDYHGCLFLCWWSARRGGYNVPAALIKSLTGSGPMRAAFFCLDCVRD